MNEETILTEEQKVIEQLQEQLKQTEHDKDLAQLEAKQAIMAKDEAVSANAALKQETASLRQQIKNERESFHIQLRRASLKHVRPIKVPCLVFGVFLVLTVLTIMCVDWGLMSHLLGEPLCCATICACAFFAGIVWDRTKK